MAGRFPPLRLSIQLMLMADKNGENNMLCCLACCWRRWGRGVGKVGDGGGSGERASRQGSHFFTASAFVYL